MKRSAIVILVLGIGLVLAPSSLAHVMLDSGGSGGGVVLHTDTLGGGGTAPAIALRPDVLGGDGESAAIPIHTDVLGGTGEPSATVTWLTNELRKDRASEARVVSGGGDSFAWGEAAGLTLLGAMLLALATVAVTRRRHRLSF